MVRAKSSDCLSHPEKHLINFPRIPFAHLSTLLRNECAIMGKNVEMYGNE